MLGEVRVDVVKIDAQGADHDVISGMQGLLHPEIAILSEFWLEGMEKRRVDPRDVLDRYVRTGFSISMLDEAGNEASADADTVIRRCESWEGRWVNLVLRPDVNSQPFRGGGTAA